MKNNEVRSKKKVMVGEIVLEKKKLTKKKSRTMLFLRLARAKK